MIGKNLQKLRRQKKLTQEALAEKIGVARQTIAKWETAESTPDLDMAGRLAAVLNVALDDLVNAPSEELDGMPGMSGGQMSNFGGSGGGIPNFGGGSGGGMPNFGGGNMRNNRGSTNNNRTN